MSYTNDDGLSAAQSIRLEALDRSLQVHEHFDAYDKAWPHTVDQIVRDADVFASFLENASVPLEVPEP